MCVPMLAVCICLYVCTCRGVCICLCGYMCAVHRCMHAHMHISVCVAGVGM